LYVLLSKSLKPLKAIFLDDQGEKVADGIVVVGVSNDKLAFPFEKKKFSVVLGDVGWEDFTAIIGERSKRVFKVSSDLSESLVSKALTYSHWKEGTVEILLSTIEIVEACKLVIYKSVLLLLALEVVESLDSGDINCFVLIEPSTINPTVMVFWQIDGQIKGDFWKACLPCSLDYISLSSSWYKN
jgi:hypothetical protein